MTLQQLDANLLQAVGNGQLQMGLEFIQSGANVNARNAAGQTPLLVAL